jgi:membrane protein involved in colicin uptake
MQTTAELEALRLKMRLMEEQAVIDAAARREAEALAFALRKKKEEEEAARAAEAERRRKEEEERKAKAAGEDFFSQFVSTVNTMSAQATETASSMFGSLT